MRPQCYSFCLLVTNSFKYVLIYLINYGSVLIPLLVLRLSQLMKRMPQTMTVCNYNIVFFYFKFIILGCVVLKQLLLKLHVVPYASMQTFPPNNGGGRGQGYQTLGSPTGVFSNFFFLRLESHDCFLFLFFFQIFLVDKMQLIMVVLFPDDTHLYNLFIGFTSHFKMS